MKNKIQKGKFIVIYGVNGTGKTTQVALLADFLKKKTLKVISLKYPIYDLEPEGPFLFKYLRDPDFRAKNKLRNDQLQKLYAENRKRYQKKLVGELNSGAWVVAEDYVGTGIAWGLTGGCDLEYLEKINAGLIEPDLAILLHGDRFTSSIEKNHRNETKSEKIKICRNFHFLLSERYGWKIIKSNNSIKKVQDDILKEIKKFRNGF